jgi:pimeloyl-ACP methyl ester carboxylesterase
MQRRHALKAVASALTGGMVTMPSRSDGSQRTAVAARPANRSPFIEARDKTRISVRDWGAGRPVVFVAPWALCSDWWDFHMTTLAAQRWRCVAFDRRGHGRSEEPGRGYDFDTLADDMSAVLETLDLRDTVLVGHSMGATEVVRYLSRHRGRRVARAVLIAPTTPFILKTDDNPDGAPADVLEKGREALKRDFHHRIAQAAPDFFGVPANHVSSETFEWWTRMIVDRCSLKVLLDLNKVMTETDFRAELRTITTPTLIVHGDSDKSARLELTGRRTHELIPGSRLIVYDGAAHGLPFTHADRLLSDILSFVA